MTGASELNRGPKLRAWQHSLIFLAAAAVVVARRPDAMIHAQFYAEGGHVWFADAYNFGWWSALLRTQDGYFQVFARLGAALALLAPMAQAPLVLNLLAIVAQALPVNLLMSGRSAGWGPWRFRALLGASCVLLPDYGEMSYSITESQWVLALCVFLLLVAEPARNMPGRVFDVAVISLSSVSGPFCAFFLPIAIFVAWTRRQAWRWVPVGLLAMAVMIQAYGLLVIDRHGRAHVPLGASADLFVRILGGNVVLGAILGRIPLATMPGRGMFILLLCAALAGVAGVTFCFIRSTFEYRLFVVFAAMIFLVSIVFPHNSRPAAGTTAWWLLAEATGARYWFLPSLAVAWTVLGCAWKGNAAVQAASVILLCGMGFGVVANFRLPGLSDLHYAEYVRNFEAAPPGTVMEFQENPPGWVIRLVKRTAQ